MEESREDSSYKPIFEKKQLVESIQEVPQLWINQEWI